MSAESDFWIECVSQAADECGLVATPEQIALIAQHAEGAHENYGMAFYSPPPSDRMADIDRGWKAKLDALQAKFDAYQDNAETAVKTALKLYSDSQVTIGKHGSVFRHDGRTEQIQ